MLFALAATVNRLSWRVCKYAFQKHAGELARGPFDHGIEFHPCGASAVGEDAVRRASEHGEHFVRREDGVEHRVKVRCALGKFDVADNEARRNVERSTKLDAQVGEVATNPFAPQENIACGSRCVGRAHHVFDIVVIPFQLLANR